MIFCFFPLLPPVSASSSVNGYELERNDCGLVVTLSGPRSVLVPVVPTGTVNRAVDAAGKTQRLDVMPYGNQFLLYSQTPWLKEATYPVRFELLYPLIESCTLV